MVSLTDLRKYRVNFNDQSNGITLFDLISSFVAAYLLDYYYFKMTNKTIYYMGVIPLGIVFHILFSQNTFLNSQLFSNESFNIYKIIMTLYLIVFAYFLFYFK